MKRSLVHLLNDILGPTLSRSNGGTFALPGMRICTRPWPGLLVRMTRRTPLVSSSFTSLSLFQILSNEWLGRWPEFYQEI
jgi:hypothetical protein